MTRPVLDNYGEELKNPKGKRWFCESCEPKGGNVKRPSIGETVDSTGSESPNLNKSHQNKTYTLNDVMQKLEEMDSKYEILLEKYEEQLKVNKQFKTEIDELKKTVKRLEEQKSESTSGVQKTTTDTLNEIRDREYRRKNLVIFGIKELDSEEPDERRSYDINIFKEILQASGTNGALESLKVVRIGKREVGKTRPMKVMMKEEEDVKTVLLKVKEIKQNQCYKNLTFSCDRTKQQLAEYKNLKQILTSRKENGEVDIGIRYIQGVPKIVKLKN